ncbi:hypothetical protein J1N35_042092 [Gossypium stocksii]|uniref:Uncharacterized protein n=1 Tax=Gossypium stocksii TaxID=47602 RepID=A0A9D3ZK97_9ROSI|nr:hypothetical protein J1N35_042092 [Gossypium stocksii]
MCRSCMVYVTIVMQYFDKIIFQNKELTTHVSNQNAFALEEHKEEGIPEQGILELDNLGEDILEEDNLEENIPAVDTPVVDKFVATDIPVVDNL